MAETTTPVQGGAVQPATDDTEARYKQWVKEKYGIEDDPETFKTKREAWKKAEEEIPQYKSTLDALIEHIKQNQEAQQQQAVKPADEFNENQVRQLARQDPYEASKRLLARYSQEVDQKLSQVAQATIQQNEASVLRREGLRRAYESVQNQWPEAFDPNAELHKVGKQVFQQEMSAMEQNHPMAFLIATERAAGRLGLAPKGKRSTNRRADVSAQSVSRSGVKGPDESEDKPLNARQRQIAAGLGVDEKNYVKALKIRKEQAKKKDEED